MIVENAEKIPICPYCGKGAEWVENKEIYGKNYGRSWMVWLCRSCDVYVGCYKNTKKPLGTMADRETREWRKKAHEVLDPIWKDNETFLRVTGADEYTTMRKNPGSRRSEVYRMLSKHFGKEIHIGIADIDMCKEIIQIVSGWVSVGV